MEITEKTLQTIPETPKIGNETDRTMVRTHRFTGKEQHFISLAEASLLTRKYRASAGRGTVKGGFFSRSIYEKVLGQKGCLGVRSYFAALNDGTPTLVLVGVDEAGNDMIRGVLGDDAFPCPPFYGCYNLLNSDLEHYMVPMLKNRVMFTGKENHSITLAEARHFVDNHRDGKQLFDRHVDRRDSDQIKGGYFSREIYEKILSQEGCVGIRNYFAENTDGTPTIVMVGVDTRGHDQITGVVADDMLLCPPFLGPDTAL